jgi:hypothetical protein
MPRCSRRRESTLNIPGKLSRGLLYRGYRGKKVFARLYTFFSAPASSRGGSSLVLEDHRSRLEGTKPEGS